MEDVMLIYSGATIIGFVALIKIICMYSDYIYHKNFVLKCENNSKKYCQNCTHHYRSHLCSYYKTTKKEECNKDNCISPPYVRYYEEFDLCGQHNENYDCKAYKTKTLSEFICGNCIEPRCWTEEMP